MTRQGFYGPIMRGPWVPVLELSNPSPASPVDDEQARRLHDKITALTARNAELADRLALELAHNQETRMYGDDLELAGEFTPAELDELVRLIEDETDDPVGAPQSAAGRRASEILADPGWTHVNGHRVPAASVSRIAPMGFNPDGTQNMLSDADRELRQRAQRARDEQDRQAREAQRAWDALPTTDKARQVVEHNLRAGGLAW